jgi:hypothetical protein
LLLLFCHYYYCYYVCVRNHSYLCFWMLSFEMITLSVAPNSRWRNWWSWLVKNRGWLIPSTKPNGSMSTTISWIPFGVKTVRVSVNLITNSDYLIS